MKNALKNALSAQSLRSAQPKESKRCAILGTARSLPLSWLWDLQELMCKLHPVRGATHDVHHGSLDHRAIPEVRCCVPPTMSNVMLAPQRS